jgi:hypothetical protein
LSEAIGFVLITGKKASRWDEGAPYERTKSSRATIKVIARCAVK